MVSAFLTGLNSFRSFEPQMPPTNTFLENMTGDFMLSDKIWETWLSLPMTTIFGRYLHIKEKIWAYIWTKKGKGVKTLAEKKQQRQWVKSVNRKEQGLENSVAEASIFLRRKGVRGYFKMHKVRSTELNQMQAWRDSITTILRGLASVQVPSDAAVTSFCGLVSLHLPSHLGLGSPGHLPVIEILCGSLCFSTCWSTCREPVPPVLLQFSLSASA